MDDEWDDLHDGEIVDLDGCEATGDPQLDQFGYQSPKRRGGTGFRSTDGDRLAKRRADRAQREQRRREAVAQNKAETRQRVAQRRGEPPGIVPFEPGSGYQPRGPNQPAQAAVSRRPDR